jgi:lipopolysaccharide transport system permease protein
MKSTRTVIQPESGLSLGLKEIWEYRELFYFFTWRDIKVKYKQTYLGIAWAVLQPLALMVIFTFIFSRNLQFKSGSVRYEVFVLSGLVLWNLFYAAVSHAAQSIIDQSNLVRKIYFPRLIIPSSAILAALFDFLIAFVLFHLCCLFFRQQLHWTAIYLFPLAIAQIVLAAFGAGTFLSALTVKFRDFRYLLPFVLQFLFFASAVLYSVDTVHPASLKYILAVNPVNGAIALFRNALGEELDLRLVSISAVSAFILGISGLLYFRKTEAYFADLA